MNNFSFYNPTKIIFGKNRITEIGKEIRNNNHKRILLLAGQGSIKTNGVYDQITASLKENKIDFVEMWGVQANPTLEKVNETIEFARKHDVDSILAVGGGSVIDSAKAVAVGFYLDDLWLFMQRKVQAKEALPLYTVLTISATGSEMNSGFVITNSKTQQKWGGGSPLLFPRVSVIDPSIQFSLPWDQTVNGGLDAIAHILEYYFVDDKAITTREIDKALIRTIISMVDRLQENPQDYSARANLAWSATLALNGISGIGMNGGDWACHTIEHALSALHPKIAHGAGLGVIFPAWIEYMVFKYPEKFSDWFEIWGEDNSISALISMRNKLRDWGSPVALRDLCIRKDELDKIADKIMEFPVIGSFSKFTREDIESILILAY
ncbi:iron-containing alcohol dehydrogenase [bacterium]|nr:iron-containing alcohol dehydrogenase [bacterium]